MAAQQSQSDPWAEAAKNFKAAPGESGTGQSQTAPNDDWKIWQDSSAPEEKTFDEKYVDPQMAPPNESLLDHIGRGAANFGGGVIGAVTAPFEDTRQTT